MLERKKRCHAFFCLLILSYTRYFIQFRTHPTNASAKKFRLIYTAKQEIREPIYGSKLNPSRAKRSIPPTAFRAYLLAFSQAVEASRIVLAVFFLDVV